MVCIFNFIRNQYQTYYYPFSCMCECLYLCSKRVKGYHMEFILYYKYKTRISSLVSFLFVVLTFDDFEDDGNDKLTFTFNTLFFFSMGKRFLLEDFVKQQTFLKQIRTELQQN